MIIMINLKIITFFILLLISVLYEFILFFIEQRVKYSFFVFGTEILKELILKKIIQYQKLLLGLFNRIPLINDDG
jgi:hypothetical protein